MSSVCKKKGFFLFIFFALVCVCLVCAHDALQVWFTGFQARAETNNNNNINK